MTTSHTLMLQRFTLLCASILITSAADAQQNQHQWPMKTDGSRTLSTIDCPTEFTRTSHSKGSYAHWLRQLPLSPKGSPVRLHDGRMKPIQSVHEAVIDIDTGKRDLQQCADAAMRLWSEYLWAHGRADEITFNVSRGMGVGWKRWRKGNRIRWKNRKARWISGRRPGTTRKDFRRYLRFIMGYAGSASLDKQLPKRQTANIRPGDLLIQGGFPGHAVIVLDTCKNTQNETLLLLGQSYMPAQDLHVLKNTSNRRLSPWYRATDLTSNRGLQTPEWRPFFAKDVRAVEQ